MRNPWGTCVTHGDLRNLTMTSCRSCLVELKKRQRWTRIWTQVLASYDQRRYPLCQPVHKTAIITSSEYNDQDLKDASKFNASLRCLPRRWLIWQEQTIGKLESSFFITYHFIYYLLIPVFIQLRMITWEMKLPWIAFYKFVLTTSCIDSWRGYDTVLPIVLCILLLCSVNRFYSYLFGNAAK